MEYRRNPHHINPMSESFQNLLSEIVVHLTKDSGKPRTVAFKDKNVTYWSDGTASQDATAHNEYIRVFEQSIVRQSDISRKTV